MMHELRSATRDPHRRLDGRLDVRSRFADRTGYRTHLTGMWGFCAGIEDHWEIVAAALPDHASRRKLPLLARDLLALGADPASLPRLPVCTTLPRCADAASAFGCLYVLEGATLGGRVLLALVQERLGVNAANGAAFLASYGDEVGTMWGTFGAAVDAWCKMPEQRASAVQAAVATFISLEHWLCAERASS